MIETFQDIINRFDKNAEKQTVVIANAIDDVSVEVAMRIREMDLGDSILVGDAEKVAHELKKAEQNPDDYEVIDAKDDVEAAFKAVEQIRLGNGHIILKGALQTGTLLKAVLNSETGIKKDEWLSHAAILELPNRKIMGIADGALNISPSLEEKKVIIENAVGMFNKLGYERPKVAILEANEEVNPRIPTSIEAEELMQMQERGEIENCVIDGPISMDIASSKEIAEAKGYNSEVAGDADIYIGSHITVLSVFAKTLQVFLGAKLVGIIFGATVPIVNISRASSAEEKITSIVTALVLNQQEAKNYVN
jgi:phosphate butyryltransferase